MVSRLMFYFKWIDQICTNPQNKIYFISQLPAGYEIKDFMLQKNV